jgi:CheY-like chemotaxis protein
MTFCQCFFCLSLSPQGVDAVQHHAARHFDLILMDGLMPVMDGFTAVARIC